MLLIASIIVAVLIVVMLVLAIALGRAAKVGDEALRDQGLLPAANDEASQLPRRPRR